VLKVVDQRAAIDGSDVGALRDAGFDDGAIVEILATIALNIFTNYLNVAFDVPVDFPQVQLRHAA
jgi:alkylhydroperoxidase family enzyme